MINGCSLVRDRLIESSETKILQERPSSGQATPPSGLNHDFPCSRLCVRYPKITQSNFHLSRWLSVSKPFDFPKEEGEVIRFWREIDAFETSLKLSEGRPEYTFYDGPPFATGLPHYGHLLAGTIKVCAQHGRGERFAYPLTRLPGHRNQTCPCQRASCFSTIRLGHPWFACRARDRQTFRNHRERRCHAHGDRQVQR